MPRKTETKSKSKTDIGNYVIVRGDRSGVYAGTLSFRDGREAVLSGARWLWYWDGAASLSQLAQEGVKSPENCKFPQEVVEIRLLDVVSVIAVTPKARRNIAEVPIWER